MEGVNNNQGYNPAGMNMNNMQQGNNHSSSNKALILVSVLIVVLLAVLLINIKKNKEEKAVDEQIMQAQAEIMANDEVTQQIQVQGNTDELNEIEKDLNATNIDSLDM